MSSCETDDSYLASPQFVSRTLHILSCLAAPIHLFGFYCILYKTPKPMATVKWILLNMHFWSVVLDIVLTVFAVPYALFPAMAGFGLGFIDSPGLFLYLIVTVINTVSISLMYTFENIFYQLFAEKTWWRTARKPFLFINSLLNPLYFLPPQFAIPDQEFAREVVLSSMPCVPELPVNRQMFVLSLDHFLVGLSVNLCGDTVAIEIWIFLNLIWHNLFKQNPEARLSQRTIKMQRKLAITVIFQSMSSAIWFVVPIGGVMAICYFDYHNQVLNNLVFVFVSSHGISATIIMVLAHKPYRDFVLSPIHRLFHKVPVVFVKASNRSARNLI